MDRLLNKIGSTVRGWMIIPAKVLNSLSGGLIKPNHITLVSLLGHIGVIWALWYSRPILAAVLLAFFGLMDSLDGALARLQKTASLNGMLYDASSDRAKEVLVYVGLTQYVFVHTNDFIWLPAAVLGGSLVVSYIKAKGEMALASVKKHDKQMLNKIFADGIARYEVRMAIVVFGLLGGQIILSLWLLLVLVGYTALQRIIRISRALNNV